MLISLALIFLSSLLLSGFMKTLGLPELLGMILAGILLGPNCFNYLDSKILLISPDIRQIALIVILSRVGLNLDLVSLKGVGRSTLLMCFLPALFELFAILIFAPILFGLDLLNSAILGTVIAAVSPAVVVPKMLKLIDEDYGIEKSIPQLIMAASSLDDVFLIVMFTSLTGLSLSNSFNINALLLIPIFIVVGVALGLISGILLSTLFKFIHVRDSVKLLILLSFSFLLLSLENNSIFQYYGMLSVISLGLVFRNKSMHIAKRLSIKYSKLWIAAEMMLFVLVGANLNIQYSFSLGFLPLILLFFSLTFRVLGVFLCLIKSPLNIKERFFCALAYMPKATVQAALGSIPLSMGLASGDTILSIAVLSILISAPVGAFLIDNSYKKLLIKN